MEISHIHPLNMPPNQWQSLQKQLAAKLEITRPYPLEQIKYCAGVDLAYWNEEETEKGACSIIVVDVKTGEVRERAVSTGIIETPYIPTYLAFRELPLVLKAVQQLKVEPDVFLFDGNGVLHPRRMGIASHAAFFLNKPTVGVAKNYFKIEGVEFKMPGSKKGDFTDIVIKGEVYGRTLRTAEDVKPIFVSAGNWISLESATQLVLGLINKESRLPVPVRLADIESKRLKRETK